MLKRIITILLLVIFITASIKPAQAQGFNINDLPAAGAMVNLSPAYVPVLIKGLRVHPENPFLFDFILDTGRSGLNIKDPAFKIESQKLIKYFLASLTIKEDDLWVNLSPYEKNRIIPDDLGKTELGQDMLGQDYILKQLTASLIYPEKKLGQEFWNRVYTKAQQIFGTSDVPVNTFNKVWIVADKAKILERNNVGYVVGAHLKVLLEEDYLALSKHLNTKAPQGNHQPTDTIASQIVREIILPELEKEVNQGKNFAPLRQIFYSMILATWYKQALKNALLNQVYSNKGKTAGVLSNDPAVKEKIYEQYLKAYKKGVFNYIKEGSFPPRKYFSGGVAPDLEINSAMTIIHIPEFGDNTTPDGAMAVVETSMDKAMIDNELKEDIVLLRFALLEAKRFAEKSQRDQIQRNLKLAETILDRIPGTQARDCKSFLDLMVNVAGDRIDQFGKRNSWKVMMDKLDVMEIKIGKTTEITAKEKEAMMFFINAIKEAKVSNDQEAEVLLPGLVKATSERFGIVNVRLTGQDAIPFTFRALTPSGKTVGAIQARTMVESGNYMLFYAVFPRYTRFFLVDKVMTEIKPTVDANIIPKREQRTIDRGLDIKKLGALPMDYQFTIAQMVLNDPKHFSGPQVASAKKIVETGIELEKLTVPLEQEMVAKIAGFVLAHSVDYPQVFSSDIQAHAVQNLLGQGLKNIWTAVNILRNPQILEFTATLQAQAANRVLAGLDSSSENPYERVVAARAILLYGANTVLSASIIQERARQYLDDYFRLVENHPNGVSMALVFELADVLLSQPRWDIMKDKKEEWMASIIREFFKLGIRELELSKYIALVHSHPRIKEYLLQGNATNPTQGTEENFKPEELSNQKALAVIQGVSESGKPLEKEITAELILDNPDLFGQKSELMDWARGYMREMVISGRRMPLARAVAYVLDHPGMFENLAKHFSRQAISLEPSDYVFLAAGRALPPSLDEYAGRLKAGRFIQRLEYDILASWEVVRRNLVQFNVPAAIARIDDFLINHQSRNVIKTNGLCLEMADYVLYHWQEFEVSKYCTQEEWLRRQVRWGFSDTEVSSEKRSLDVKARAAVLIMKYPQYFDNTPAGSRRIDLSSGKMLVDPNGRLLSSIDGKSLRDIYDELRNKKIFSNIYFVMGHERIYKQYSLQGLDDAVEGLFFPMVRRKVAQESKLQTFVNNLGISFPRFFGQNFADHFSHEDISLEKKQHAFLKEILIRSSFPEDFSSSNAMTTVHFPKSEDKIAPDGAMAVVETSMDKAMLDPNSIVLDLKSIRFELYDAAHSHSTDPQSLGIEIEKHLNNVGFYLDRIPKVEAQDFGRFLGQIWDFNKAHPEQFGKGGSWRSMIDKLDAMDETLGQPSAMTKLEKNGIMYLISVLKGKASTYEEAEGIIDEKLRYYVEKNFGLQGVGVEDDPDMLPFNQEVMIPSGEMIQAKDARALVRSGRAMLFYAGIRFFLVDKAMTTVQASRRAAVVLSKINIMGRSMDGTLEKMLELFIEIRKLKEKYGDLKVDDVRIGHPSYLQDLIQLTYMTVVTRREVRKTYTTGDPTEYLKRYPSGYILRPGQQDFIMANLVRLIELGVFSAKAFKDVPFDKFDYRRAARTSMAAKLFLRGLQHLKVLDMAQISSKDLKFINSALDEKNAVQASSLEWRFYIAAMVLRNTHGFFNSKQAALARKVVEAGIELEKMDGPVKTSTMSKVAGFVLEYSHHHPGFFSKEIQADAVQNLIRYDPNMENIWTVVNILRNPSELELRGMLRKNAVNRIIQALSSELMNNRLMAARAVLLYGGDELSDYFEKSRQFIDQYLLLSKSKFSANLIINLDLADVVMGQWDWDPLGADKNGWIAQLIGGVRATEYRKNNAYLAKAIALKYEYWSGKGPEPTPSQREQDIPDWMSLSFNKNVLPTRGDAHEIIQDALKFGSPQDQMIAARFILDNPQIFPTTGEIASVAVEIVHNIIITSKAPSIVSIAILCALDHPDRFPYLENNIVRQAFVLAENEGLAVAFIGHPLPQALRDQENEKATTVTRILKRGNTRDELTDLLALEILKRNLKDQTAAFKIVSDSLNQTDLRSSVRFLEYVVENWGRFDISKRMDVEEFVQQKVSAMLKHGRQMRIIAASLILKFPQYFDSGMTVIPPGGRQIDAEDQKIIDDALDQKHPVKAATLEKRFYIAAMVLRNTHGLFNPEETALAKRIIEAGIEIENIKEPVQVDTISKIAGFALEYSRKHPGTFPAGIPEKAVQNLIQYDPTVSNIWTAVNILRNPLEPELGGPLQDRAVARIFQARSSDQMPDRLMAARAVLLYRGNTLLSQKERYIEESRQTIDQFLLLSKNRITATLNYNLELADVILGQWNWDSLRGTDKHKWMMGIINAKRVTWREGKAKLIAFKYEYGPGIEPKSLSEVREDEFEGMPNWMMLKEESRPTVEEAKRIIHHSLISGVFHEQVVLARFILDNNQIFPSTSEVANQARKIIRNIIVGSINVSTVALAISCALDHPDQFHYLVNDIDRQASLMGVQWAALAFLGHPLPRELRDREEQLSRAITGALESARDDDYTISVVLEILRKNLRTNDQIRIFKIVNQYFNELNFERCVQFTEYAVNNWDRLQISQRMSLKEFLQRVVTPALKREGKLRISAATFVIKYPQYFDPAQISEPGGIDLNARNIGLDIAKEGNGVEMKFDPAMVAEFQRGDFSGIIPVIMRITPITNALSILGLE